MNESVEKRAVMLAKYIIETKSTVRAAAKQFDVSKSTVHTDVSKRLLLISPALAQAVRLVLDENKAQRHIRGCNATKEKYAVLSEKKVD